MSWHEIKKGLRTINENSITPLTVVALLLTLGVRPVPAPAQPCRTWVIKAAPNAGPSDRFNPAMAYDSGRGVTVLFGGRTGPSIGGALVENHETWEWNGSLWTQKVPTCTPGTDCPDRAGPMVYDSGRGLTLVFDVAGQQTWEWNGNVWTRRPWPCQPGGAPGTGCPSNVGVGAAAYDSARSLTVAFNGSETWEWDGAAWNQSASECTPGTDCPSTYGAAAYDSARGVIVVVTSDPATISEMQTWEWDGDSWARRGFPCTPGTDCLPPRDTFAMVYDNARQVILLFGGRDPSVALAEFPGDSWEWDGTTWHAANIQWSADTGHSATPFYWPGISLAGMAYDQNRQTPVRFGGYSEFAAGTLTDGRTYELSSDLDCDEWADSVDNCPTVSNPDQADDDGDGIGNACECGDCGAGIPLLFPAIMLAFAVMKRTLGSPTMRPG